VEQTRRHTRCLAQLARHLAQSLLDVVGARHGAAYSEDSRDAISGAVSIAASGPGHLDAPAPATVLLRQHLLELDVAKLPLPARRAPAGHEAGVSPAPEGVLADAEKLGRGRHPQPAMAARRTHVMIDVHTACFDIPDSFLDQLSTVDGTLDRV